LSLFYLIPTNLVKIKINRIAVIFIGVYQLFKIFKPLDCRLLKSLGG
jgi:hypothetical protein